MKSPAPFFLLIIPIGMLVVVLVLLCIHFLDPLVFLLESLFMKTRPGFARMPLYIGVVLIPVLAGLLMGAAIFILVKREDREYERMLNDAEGAVYEEVSRRLDFLDFSISRLQHTSKRIRLHAEELTALSVKLGKSLEMPEVKADTTETRTITLENNTVTDLQFIRPAGGPIPPEPVPFPQSHQRRWFYPRK
jgi:hypothetical protein